MTTVNSYTEQISEIAAFAKRKNITPTSENLNELVRLWLVDTQCLYQGEGKEKAMQIIKSII